MRIQVIARYMGLVLLVNALFMFIAVIISAIYGFDTGFHPCCSLQSLRSLLVLSLTYL